MASCASVLDLAATWLSKCLGNHHRCGKASPHELPTRVIDVGVENAVNVQLLKGSPLEGYWAALSYCWGEQGFLKTTKNNISEHFEGIRLSKLPKTLRDAVLITRRLGLRYIWIDALCIIQDDTEDWEREAAKMNRVYKDCVITIAAANSSGAKHGIFRKRRTAAQAVSVPMKGSSFSGNAIIYPEEILLKDFNKSILDGQGNRLRFRGWTLQEWILPTRTIYFAEDQLYWECPESVSSESEPNDQNNSFRYNSSCGGAKSFLLQTRAGTLAQDLNTPGIYAHWRNIVEDYSRRSLTKRTDKLIAIAGIAAEFSSLLGRQSEIGDRGKCQGDSPDDKYLAGLWKGDLIPELMWKVMDLEDDQTEKMSKESDYIAPPWSWATLKPGTHLTYELKNREHLEPPKDPKDAQITKTNILLKDKGAFFGKILKGSCITIRGRWFRTEKHLPKVTDHYPSDNENTRSQITEMAAGVGLIDAFSAARHFTYANFGGDSFTIFLDSAKLVDLYESETPRIPLLEFLQLRHDIFLLMKPLDGTEMRCRIGLAVLIDQGGGILSLIEEHAPVKAITIE